MFKNMFKRAWLSVKRKPSRSIIIGLIFLAMSNLILATIIIKSAVNESTEYAKEALGGTVSLQADMSAMRENMKSQNMEPGQMFERPSVVKNTADAIAKSSYVKDYTYSISTTANASALTAVESNKPKMGGGGPGGMDKQSSSTTTTGTYTIYGINAYAYVEGVDEGSTFLKSGDYFDESSTDSVLISVDLAEKNNLSVGSSITFTNIYTSKDVKLKVIGIYDSSSNFSDANTIYMNTDTAAKLLSTDDYNNGNYKVEDVSYTLVNAEDAETFIAEVKEKYPELAENKITIAQDTAMYEQMAGPIESVGSFATTLLIIVIIASVAIIALIVTINVKDRRYEMGVLLSLGAKKTNIIGQIFVELAIIGTIAFGLSCCTATALAKVMGQGILESQTASSQVESQKNFGRPTTGGGGGNAPAGMPSDDSSNTKAPDDEMMDNNAPDKSDETITEIDINAKPIDFVLLFVCGYSIILLALLIPAINILRYQPKTILQGKE